MTTLSGLVGLVGDVHAEDRALERGLALFEARQVSTICCVGDLVDGPGDPNRTLQLLNEHQVHMVRGNHDHWILEGILRSLPEAQDPATLSAASVELLRNLPVTREFQSPAGALLLCHGIADDDMIKLKPDDTGYALEVNEPLQRLVREARYRFVVGGHTHVRMVRHFGRLTVINAGTLLHDHDPCVGLLDFEAGAVQFFDYLEESFVEAERLPIGLPA